MSQDWGTTAIGGGRIRAVVLSGDEQMGVKFTGDGKCMAANQAHVRRIDALDCIFSTAQPWWSKHRAMR